jgi:exonuclease VII large subunit
MNEAEVRDAVHDYKVHLKHEVVVAEAQIDTCDSSLSNTSADVDATLDVGEQVPATPTQVADSIVLPSSNSSSSKIVVAMQAMTAAAERLTTAAARIEAAAQTQRVQQPQQQQQMQQYMLTVHPWQMQRHWQQVMHQRQQQQLRLAYYQQHMYNFKRQCLR